MHPLMTMTVPAGRVAIHWFGQSTYALKNPAGTIVLVDPYFPRERTADRFVHLDSPLDEATLKPDVVLLTHNHMDHTFAESITRIQQAHQGVKYIGPFESIDTARSAGVPVSQCKIVHAGDSFDMDTMKAHTVYSKPPEGLPDDGIDKPDVTHLGYVIETGGVNVYISGDPVNTFGEHESLLAPVRSLRPDIGMLTQHPSEGEFPFFAGTAKIAKSLGLKTAVPAHYDCFAQRTYDPQTWAAQMPKDGPKPLILKYNETRLYPQESAPL